MTRAIHKFPIHSHTITLMMDPNAQFIHVHEQDGQGCLWAVVDPDAGLMPATFVVFATAQRGIPDDHTYVGTWHEDGLVWHLFYKEQD